MKKKIILIAGIISCAAISFFNVSHSWKSNSVNSDLFALVKINDASAECIYTSPEYRNTGKCNYGYDICYYDLFHNECDPAY